MIWIGVAFSLLVIFFYATMPLTDNEGRKVFEWCLVLTVFGKRMLDRFISEMEIEMRAVKIIGNRA